MFMRESLVVVALLMSAPTPAFAQAGDFILVNGTGGGLSDVSVRRAGSKDWRALGAAPSAGARSPVQFKDPDCAFDFRASVPGAGPVTWMGVNLCGAKSVTLKRDGSTGPWVDYDE